MNFVYTRVEDIVDRAPANRTDRLRYLHQKYGRKASAVQEKEIAGSGGSSPFRMGRMTSEIRYQELLTAFQKKISDDRANRIKNSPHMNAMAVATFNVQGRKFDKIMVAKVNAAGVAQTPEVVYFVHKETNAIFGAKSPVSPNTRHFYGTLDTVSEWDWSEDMATPIDLEAAGVEVIKTYDKYTHYAPTDRVLLNKLVHMDIMKAAS